MNWLTDTTYKALLVGVGFGLIIAVLKIFQNIFGSKSSADTEQKQEKLSNDESIKEIKNENFFESNFEKIDVVIKVIAVISIALLVYIFFQKFTKSEKTHEIAMTTEYSLLSCSRVEKNELIEDESFRKLEIVYLDKKAKLIYFNSKNEVDEEIDYENCKLDEYENVCRNVVEEKGEKVKTVLKFKLFEKKMTYEIFEESDKLEKNSLAKWQCKTKK